MKIKVKRCEEFSVIPSIGKDEQNPPKIIFREPNSADILKYMWANDLNGLLYECFVRFENKIELVDENNKEIEYGTYKELIEISINEVTSIIHCECAKEMTERINKMKELADKTEKKSKSPTKS